MRRLIIIRKDLHLSPGKLVAMCMHCAEAYWTNLLKNTPQGFQTMPISPFDDVVRRISIPSDIWNEYVNGIFTKTVCEAKNLNHLKKIEAYIDDVACELEEGKDYGWINDKCLTELKPENPDGTTTIGIWFRPLPDDIAHVLSKKYHLYVSDGDKVKRAVAEAMDILQRAIEEKDWNKVGSATEVLSVVSGIGTSHE